jgi:hypothetical protein
VASASARFEVPEELALVLVAFAVDVNEPNPAYIVAVPAWLAVAPQSEVPLSLTVLDSSAMAVVIQERQGPSALYPVLD